MFSSKLPDSPTDTRYSTSIAEPDTGTFPDVPLPKMISYCERYPVFMKYDCSSYNISNNESFLVHSSPSTVTLMWESSIISASFNSQTNNLLPSAVNFDVFTSPCISGRNTVDDVASSIF